MTKEKHMAEAELIEACLRQDRRAQQLLYDRYKNAMFTLAYRITGDFNLSADVLQDAFIQVFLHLKDFRAESTLGAWIKRIVVRTAIRAAKKVRHFEDIDSPVFKGKAINQQHVFEAERIESAILQLPPGYRSVFVLTEVEGYTHKEVATILGITEGTSKSQLFYAKKKMRDYLNHQP